MLQIAAAVARINCSQPPTALTASSSERSVSRLAAIASPKPTKKSSADVAEVAVSSSRLSRSLGPPKRLADQDFEHGDCGIRERDFHLQKESCERSISAAGPHLLEVLGGQAPALLCHAAHPMGGDGLKRIAKKANVAHGLKPIDPDPASLRLQPFRQVHVTRRPRSGGRVDQYRAALPF